MNKTRMLLLATLTPLIPLLGFAGVSRANEPSPSYSLNPGGILGTRSTAGVIDTTGAFFQSIGTNGRTCSTCHQSADGMSINPTDLQIRFLLSNGTDPVFRTVDGSNSPNADVSTFGARLKAYSMLLNKGVIRIGIGIPAGAQFSLVKVDDPYGFASASQLSLFRRPLPATNLRFLSAVMWDGRETVEKITGPLVDSTAALEADLAHQAIDATTGHAQGAVPSNAQVQDIVNFELGLTTAQEVDFSAGILSAYGANGGSAYLQNVPFYIGINDVLGGDPTGAPFTTDVMTLYASWTNADSNRNPFNPGFLTQDARASVARGEAIFNNTTINITGVKGLNDALGVTTFKGGCVTCHDSPNVGNHSVSLPLDIGLTDASRRTPDMPLYTLQNNTTGEQIQTTDPGRALISGAWADIGKFKGPILHGLAARPPYFHNGFAADLDAVVDFYNTRFSIGFTTQQHNDLVNFLKTL